MQSLKLCQKANSSPPWGLALNLPGLSVFRGTEEEAISDKVLGGGVVSPEPTSHAEKSGRLPPGLHASLLICELFCFRLH